MVGSVADTTVAVGARHLERGARRAPHLVAVAANALGPPRLGEPVGNRLTDPRVTAFEHLARVGRGDERGLDHDAIGVGHLNVALVVDGAVHLAAHDPTQVGRDRLDLVERHLPSRDAQTGLLFHLTCQAREHGAVLGVDHAARRAPVLVTASPLVAHEEQPAVGLDERAGDDPLTHGLRHGLSVARAWFRSRRPPYHRRPMGDEPPSNGAGESGEPGDALVPSGLPSRGAYVLAFLSVVLAGAFGGVIGAGGVGIVAVLVLRAMAEWQRGGKRAR